MWGGVTCEEGGMSAGKLWQLKKKLRGIITQPPTAMLDQYGNLVTTNKAVEDLTPQMYQDRLKALEIKENLKLHKIQQEGVCDERLKEATQIYDKPFGGIAIIMLGDFDQQPPIGGWFPPHLAIALLEKEYQQEKCIFQTKQSWQARLEINITLFHR